MNDITQTKNCLNHVCSCLSITCQSLFCQVNVKLHIFYFFFFPFKQADISFQIRENSLQWCCRYQIPDDWPYPEARKLFKEPLVITDDQLELKWAAPDEEVIGFSNFFSLFLLRQFFGQCIIFSASGVDKLFGQWKWV